MLNRPRFLPAGLWMTAALVMPGMSTSAQIAPVISNVVITESGPQFTVTSAVGLTNQIQTANEVAGSNWIILTNFPVTATPYDFVDETAPRTGTRFYRVAAFGSATNSPFGDMVLIPAGTFAMGDAFNEGDNDEQPLHDVVLNAFYVDQTEVTTDQMVQAMQWAYEHGKISVTSTAVTNLEGNPQALLDLNNVHSRITWDGSQFRMKPTKASGYPTVLTTWYGAVAFCNYRSQMEALTPCYNLDDWSCDWSADGYRLPTEAEWERAARGGVSGKRFPWSDVNTISHSRANYESVSGNLYDVSPTSGYHPTYAVGEPPYTSPVGSFPANDYGLQDAAGNVWEWCWDWYGSGYYSQSPATDPTGPATGSDRVVRGGSWYDYARDCRVSYRSLSDPAGGLDIIGFRCVRSATTQ